jgi:hypothetical protein
VAWLPPPELAAGVEPELKPPESELELLELEPELLELEPVLEPVELEPEPVEPEPVEPEPVELELLPELELASLAATAWRIPSSRRASLMSSIVRSRFR